MAPSNRPGILVTGAGGFIGHHLVKRLKREGYWVRGADIKYPEYEPSPADEFELVDLRRRDNCLQATRHIEQVYNLAADMGGIGYITDALGEIAKNNVLINAHMLEASHVNGVAQFLFASSACVYAQYKQERPEAIPLKEEDAYPAAPEPGYGWGNCLRRNYAATSGETLGSTLGLCGSTTFAAHWAHMRAGKKRHRLRCAARSRWRGRVTRSRSGGREANPVVHVRGRLRRGVDSVDEVGLPRAPEPWHRSSRHDRRTRGPGLWHRG